MVLSIGLDTICFLTLALITLPQLWRDPQQRPSFWVAAALFAVGYVSAVTLELGYNLLQAWPIVAAIFRPIGTLLFTPAQ